MSSHTLDVKNQLESFKQLQNGWLDGQGLAPPHESLNWLEQQIDQHYPEELARPYMYPTPEGNVRAEWDFDCWTSSLEIDFHDKTGHWHQLNIDTDEEAFQVIELENAESWCILKQMIEQLAGKANG